MLTFSDLLDFNQLQLGLCQQPKPLHETLLWERSLVFSLLAASNTFFLLLLFGLLVSFGLTPTKRQFSGRKFIGRSSRWLSALVQGSLLHQVLFICFFFNGFIEVQFIYSKRYISKMYTLICFGICVQP